MPLLLIHSALATSTSKFRTVLAAVAAVLPGVAPPLVVAQERAPVAWDFTLENDKWGNGGDRHYTHGTRIARSSDATPQWARKVAAPLRCLACTSPSEFKIEFGQEIYTPENTRTRALVVDDRPYAGWAYAAMSLSGERDVNARRQAINSVTLELGVIGPAAGADRTQALMHRERDVRVARGWDHQLQNEVGAVLTYKRGVRMPLGREGGAFHQDVSPYFEVAAGNIHSHVGGGVAWRSGSNLESASRTAARGWRLFADVNTRIVGRNALLGGNIETGSYHSVEKEPVVATVAAGIEYKAPRFSLRFAREHRGPEFVGQRGADEFGALSFSVSP
jgi:lipid A 3-O-deacylase